MWLSEQALLLNIANVALCAPLPIGYKCEILDTIVRASCDCLIGGRYATFGGWFKAFDRKWYMSSL